MRTFMLLLVLLVCSEAYEDKNDKTFYRTLKQLIRELRKSQSNEETEKAILDERNNTEIQANEKAKENIRSIDREKVDPKSKDLSRFSSMIVLNNGKITKPNDLPVDQSPFAQGLKKDSHKLTHQQKVELGMESETPNEKMRGTGVSKISKRGFTDGALWEKNIVPYVIDESLSDIKQLIETAIKVYKDMTCVQWLPLSESVQSLVGHQTFIKFYKGEGCWSSVSRSSSKTEQLLSLGSGCGSLGIALHEMLHAMGQWHEQSRLDRDQHVSISSELLKDGANYGKKETRDYNPYDYESVMQYGFGGGLEPLQPELKFLTSVSSGLSFYDVADITDAYKCTGSCVNPPVCKNGGFLNHKCECFCPYGLTGTTCDTVVNADVCGGIIDIVPGSEVTITSPNFPRNYDVDRICVWLLRAPPSNRVKIQSDVFHLPHNVNDNRCYHWLEIRYNLVGQTGLRVCGDSSGDEWVTTKWGEQNLMLLVFDSKFGKLHAPEKGFSLHASVAAEGCIPNPCVYGVCKDCGNKDYKCECDPGFEGRKCDQAIDGETVTCSFEKGSKCFLQNAEGDNFDWRLYSGSTPSDYTGPDGAYSGDNYMYAEASTRVEGDKAALQSDITFTNGDRCISFYYNMHGNGIGSLSVYAGSSQIWSKSGDQGFGWRFAQASVPSTENLKIRIEATRGADWEGDIGIDEIKLYPGQCESAVKEDCYTDSIGKEYKGTLSRTIGGLTCQRWDSNTPNSHSYHEYDGDENYCRNTRGDEPAPWCYTTSADKRWDFCDLKHCDLETCSRSKNGYDYIGDKDITIQGEKCKDDTKCRSTASEPKPWCYTNNPLVSWDACDVPKCTTPPKECRLSRKGVEYFGSISKTESGKTCQRWDKQTPFQNSYWYLDDQENYCRNPDGSARPWCYPDDPNATGFEYCNVPACEELGCSSDPCLYGATCQNTDNGGHVCNCKPGYTGSNCGTRIQEPIEADDCRRSASGYEYSGKISTTISGRTCQQWSLDTPHAHNYNTLPENYCRNPDKEPAPWCYTTDTSKRFELCDIPQCSVPAKECLETEKGENYFGTVRNTQTGIPCQRWDSQTPYTHSYSYLGDQADYCRNAYGEESSPWCYTTDPNTRWDYCAIPIC